MLPDAEINSVTRTCVGGESMLSKLWTTEKRRLADVLFERVIKGRERIPYQEMVSCGFPEFFEACIRHRARKIFRTEDPVEVNTNDRYNIQETELKNQLLFLERVFVSATIFRREEIRAVADFAVNFQFDVIVRPRQTLEEILFRSSNSQNKSDVSVVLKGFGDSRLFVKKMLKKIEAMDSETIDQENFEGISRTVERQIYDETPLSALLDDVNSLIEFEASITGKEDRGVHSDVLLGMLEERDLYDMANELTPEASGKEFWSVAEIENALERYLLVGRLDHSSLPSTDSSNSKDVAETAPDSIEPIEASDPPSAFTDACSSDEQRRDEKPKPFRIQFAEDNSRSAGASRSEQRMYSRVNGKPVFLTYDEDLIINRSDIERQPPGPYPALASLIGPKDRKLFIKRIFRRDKQQYMEFIQRLETLDLWKDAKAVIDEELRVREISPYSKEAVLLGDVVFSRYFRN